MNLGRAGGRFSGWQSNPNGLGLILVSVFPFLFARAIREPGWRLFGPRFETLALVALALATGSRATVLAMAGAAGVILYGTGRLGRWIPITACAVALVLFFAGHTLGPVLEDVPGIGRFFKKEVVGYVTGQSAFHASGREEAWALADRLIHANPWYGYGWGAEARILAEHKDELIGHQGALVHNSYLSLMLEAGILGLLPAGALFLLGLGRGWRSLGRASDAREAELQLRAATLVALVLGGLMSAFFESWLFSTGSYTSLVFWPALFMLLRSPWWRPLQDEPPRVETFPEFS